MNLLNLLEMFIYIMIKDLKLNLEINKVAGSNIKEIKQYVDY